MLGISEAREQRYKDSASEGEKSDSVDLHEKFKKIQWSILKEEEINKTDLEWTKEAGDLIRLMAMTSLARSLLARGIAPRAAAAQQLRRSVTIGVAATAAAATTTCCAAATVSSVATISFGAFASRFVGHLQFRPQTTSS